MRIQDATAAARAFTQAVKGETVSEEEILRRERICSTCPKKKKNANVRNQISRTLGMLANKNRVRKEISGYSCGVCGCSMMLLLPAKSEDLHKDSPKEAEERPDFCWLPEAVK